jgi:hypothetical protein
MILPRRFLRVGGSGGNRVFGLAPSPPHQLPATARVLAVPDDKISVVPAPDPAASGGAFPGPARSPSTTASQGFSF